MDDLIGIIVGVLGSLAALAAIWREIRQMSPREQLLQDIEIRNALPANSDAQRSFDNYIRDAAKALTNSKIRRDWPGVAVAAFLLALGGGTYWIFISIESWPRWVLIPFLAFFLLFGIVGGVESFLKKERNEKGNATTPAPPRSPTPSRRQGA